MSDYTYIASTGSIVPNTNEVLTKVQEQFKAVFGQDLVVDPETPQGVLIGAITIFLTAVIQNNALMGNQFNPNYSGGVFLDALYALTGGERVLGTYSTVTAELTGVAGTVVPANAIAETEDGDQFRLTQDTVIPGDSEWQAVKPGAILCPSNALTNIITPIQGWEGITNPTAQNFIGSEEQSDYQVRTLRNETLAVQGMGLIESIYGRLRILEGVKGLHAQENEDSITKVVNGVTMKPHSIYVCVDGGVDYDIAFTLTAVKNGGCGYNNGPADNTYHRSIPVTNTISGQTINVLFDRPVLYPIYITVTVKNNNTVPELVANIRSAISDYANGLFNNEPGLTLGQPVSPLEFGGAINQRFPQVFITDICVGFGPNPTNRETLPIPVYGKAYLINQSSIVVNVI